ncbi:fibronectin type III domain-containing protein, partial [Stenotrophomonas maltophilia group sp. RNC7]|uniref:fibronectin type III domain-containing protein n=1 Tax=Stenotrophomonas maltophilia group sp. RNC7 TaxID=3071467 RepID=UPI0027E14AF8
RAKSGSFVGEWSESVTVATLLGTPSNINGTAESNRITVTWDAVIGATAYEIEADGNLIDVGSEQRFVHENLLPNTLHTYRVRAKNNSVVSEWSGMSDWSTVVPIMTPPAVPTNLQATATTNEMKLTWDAVENAKAYDIEVDEKIIYDLSNSSYEHVKLEPNTRHRYRVRSKNDGGVSEWTELLEQNTIPEITINVEKDNMFNFVIVAPKKDGAATREIVVTYDPEKLEVLDLRAETPEVNLGEGPVAGSDI